MEAFTKKNVKAFVDILSDKLLEFSIKHLGICEGDAPNIRIFMNLDAGNSCYFKTAGKQSFIRLALEGIDTEYAYNEYNHIKHDSEIGNVFCLTEDYKGDFHTGNWKKYVATLLCHEYAHFVDVMTEKKIAINTNVKYHKADHRVPEDQRDMHGEKWQHIYRVFRNEFVNTFKFESIDGYN